MQYIESSAVTQQPCLCQSTYHFIANAIWRDDSAGMHIVPFYACSSS